MQSSQNANMNGNQMHTGMANPMGNSNVNQRQGAPNIMPSMNQFGMNNSRNFGVMMNGQQGVPPSVTRHVHGQQQHQQQQYGHVLQNASTGNHHYNVSLNGVNNLNSRSFNGIPNQKGAVFY